jgi:serine/threonine protein kinase/WD40 repeat protein
MGTIYEAIQEPLGRRVAVKTIRDRKLHLAGTLHSRFLREQKVLAQLHHTHIVPIQSAGHDGDLQYFAMSYIDGAALHHVVRTAKIHGSSSHRNGRTPTPTLAVLAAQAKSRMPSSNGPPQPAEQPTSTTISPIPPPQAEVELADLSMSGKLVLSPEYFRSVARVMVDAAEAVQHAHDAGINHRDLKPSNLMVDTSEHCWVLDFGLAGYLRAQADEGKGTGSQAQRVPVPFPGPAVDLGPDPPTVSGIMGTPDYMAPEQFQGRADARTDVWGLGVILYELLTLRRPFKSPGEIAGDDPSRPCNLVEGLPRDLEAICLKALRRESTKRYQSARDLAADLRRWLCSEPVTARKTHTLRRPALWAKRNKGYATAIAVGVLAILGLGSAGTVYYRAEAAAAQSRERIRQREVLIQEIQRIRILRHQSGWRKRIGGRIMEAKQLGGDDNSLRKEAIPSLRELDASERKNLLYPASHLAFDPQGRRLYSCWFQDRVIRVWDLEIDETRTLGLKGHGPFAFRPDGPPLQLAEVDKEGRTLVLHDLAREAVLRKFTSPRPDRPFYVDFAITPSGSHVAALWQESKPKAGVDPPDQAPPVLIVVWEAATGALVRAMEHHAPAVSMALAPDGRMVAVGDTHGNVAVWTLPGGNSYSSLSASDNRIQCLAFGREPLVSYRQKSDTPAWQLAAGDGAGIVTMLDLRNGRIRNWCRGSSDVINALAFRSDGAVLVSAGRGVARLWDVATGRLLLDVPAGNTLPKLAFSPDGQRLAVARERAFGDNDGVRVFDLRTGQGMQSLLGLQAKIERLVFSGDGWLFAALSDDWRVGIWDRSTGQLLHLFALPPGFFADNAGMAFDATSRRLVCSGGEHATLWDLEAGRLLQTWKLPPGLQDKLTFRGPNELSLFRCETRDRVPPFNVSHPRDHPRIYRLYNLLGPSPLRPVKEIGDHDLYCFGILTPAYGRFMLADGAAMKDGREVRTFVAYDGRTGETLWSMPAHRGYRDENGILHLDPTGTILVLLHHRENTSTWLRLPSREWIADRVSWGGPLGPGGNRWFTLMTDPATQRGEWHYFPSGQDGPEIAIAEGEFAIGPTFEPDGREVAWVGPDHSVVVCDLVELQRAMAEYGLGW